MLKKRLLKNQKGNQGFPSTRILPNSSKGLSAVVTTLIVILLVLVAVGIMWVVVRSLVQEGAEEIELGRFTLDLEIKRAQIENNDVTVVVVRRNPGEGNYIGMNFVFFDGTNSEIIRENTTLQELEERSFTFTLTEISTDSLETISVAPIFELSSGEESVGDVADSFEVSEEMREGITGGAVSNFAALGFTGMGRIEYDSISSGTPQLPEFKKAIIDPLDVLPGDNQTFTVDVYSPYSIVNVTSITELDNSTLNLDFEKIGTDPENSSIEIWSASWIVNDTHAIEYKTNVTATDSEENQNYIVLTWTDSCQSQMTHGGNDAITQDCSTVASAVGGLDGGSLTINGGITMTISSGSTWAFNNGKTITPTGTIIVTGQIKKAYLFYTDADGDYYTPNAVMTFNTASSLPGYVRAQNLLGNPTSPQNDCCDTDANAKPGQLTYFTTPRSGGCSGLAYDYNCDTWEIGNETLEYGECTDCYANDICNSILGSRGWSYQAAPDCGDATWYVNRTGRCGSLRNCVNDYCEEEQRYQACR